MTTTTPNHRYPIDERSERILAAALTEFARRGFAGAREGVIARRAGVSLATLRLYFPSKDELFREVIRSSIVNSIRSDDQEGAPEPERRSAIQRLHDFARRFWRSMDQPGHAALLQLSVGELPRFPELALFHATEVLGRAASRLERTLTDGVAGGEFRIPDPRAAARFILAALITHAHWFALPSIYSGITGADRTRAESAALDVVADALRASAR